MSVAATVPGPAFSILSWIDRGLSSEAEALRKLTSAATEFSGSVTLGQPKRVARETLDAAYLSAREENWDGMGSARVEPTTYAYASQFLRILSPDLAAPGIAVDTDGEILFEWDRGPRQTFSVSIGRDGTLTFAGLLGYRKVHGTEHFSETLPLVIADWIQDITAQPTNGANG